MHSLGEGIIRSYEDRIRGVRQIHEAVRTELGGFDNVERAIRTQLKADLARSHQDVTAQGRVVYQNLRRMSTERKSAVQSKLRDLDNAERSMREQLMSNLAKSDQERRAQARTRAQEMRREVAARHASVKSQLNSLAAAQKKMGDQLRTNLSKSEEERMAQARALDKELKKKLSELRTSVSAELKVFGVAHKDMSDQLRSKLIKDFANLKSSVHAQVGELAAVRVGGVKEWIATEKTMQSKRRVKGGSTKSAPAAVAAKPREAVSAEKEEAGAEVAEAIPEIAALGDRVLQYLTNHSDGTRLVDLEQEFGLSRIQMVRVVRNLMDQDKVVKRDILYFAT